MVFLCRTKRCFAALKCRIKVALLGVKECQRMMLYHRTERKCILFDAEHRRDARMPGAIE